MAPGERIADRRAVERLAERRDVMRRQKGLEPPAPGRRRPSRERREGWSWQGGGSSALVEQARRGDALDHRVGGRKRRFADAIGGAKALRRRLGSCRDRAHECGRAARRGRPRRRSARARSGRRRGRSRRRRAPGRRRVDHGEPDRANVDLFDEPGRPRRRVDQDRGARQKLMGALNEILRSAESCDHALEPLGRPAAVERAPQGRFAGTASRARPASARSSAPSAIVTRSRRGSRLLPVR